ncbi:MAG TPA: IS701 family transposase [Ktedonobacteraceae bacterium]|nr:IS701 family transposase [Ktedonobacteraceae bacterium]
MNMKAVPKAAPTPLPELETYLEPFTKLFRRSWSRQSCERYITGLLTDLPHKNCETIAAALAGTSTERLQHLLTDADWDALALHQLRVQHLLSFSPKGGLLALDDTSLLKQGRESVGVARQYSGVKGKPANCQAVVTAEYIVEEPNTQSILHWPVNAHLYLPESWIADTKRRGRTRVPDEVPAQTKHEIALQLIDQALRWQVPFKVILADAGYGRNASFLKGLEERKLHYVCGVECTFGVRRPEEVALAQQVPPPPRTGKNGRPRKAHPAPLYTVQEIIATLPDDQWQTITWREGSRGPMRKQFVAVRMHWAMGTAARTREDQRVYTGAEGWLIGEKPLPGEEGECKYYFSNLPAEMRLEQLVPLVRGRWPIEQFYEEAKQECGLDDYQGRRWDGLHRHLALVMLAYSFLVSERMRTEQDSAGSPDSCHPKRSPLPAIHRNILLWLLQDLVLWWIATDHVKTFRSPRVGPG